MAPGSVLRDIGRAMPEGSKDKRAPRDPYFSHWADIAALRTLEAAGEGECVTVAAGITPSGIIHVGNFREIITVDLVARALRDQGVEVRFIYSWDDFDVFRKVPAGIPQPEMLEENLRRSVADVPDPYGEHDSYASHFIAQLEQSIRPLGIEPQFIRQSRRYRAGDYAQGIQRALEASTAIREILNRHRTTPLSEDWLPLAGFCAECGRDDLTFRWPGEWIVEYTCASCAHEGKVDLREGGNVKLPWRVDWPMRWAEEGVVFEPGGKDHSSAGGSFDTAKEIVAGVYGGQAPQYVAYDFVRVKGRGGKISSSAGDVVTVADCLEIYEPQMLRWIFASQRPGSEFQISFDLDVIKLYEDFDRARRLAHEAEDGSKADKKRQIARRTFELACLQSRRIEPGSTPAFVPPFRGLSTVLQAYDGDIDRAIAHYEESGEIGSDVERELCRARAGCCWSWIETYAPEDFRYRIRREPVVRELADDQRIVIARLVGLLCEQPDISEDDLVPHMKTLCEGTELTLKAVSPLVYDLLIDRDHGPKITTLLTTLGGDRAVSLLSACLDAVPDLEPAS
ncbi:MAG: lysine--tRNA ligase [Deltaproteobacteria bacterium]|nr:lysine--tRNA ligase [Deltaproteobacteria bacterium]